MALAITYDELRRAIGRFLFGARSVTTIEGDTNWNTDTEDILLSGLRQFYYAQLPARRTPTGNMALEQHGRHVWSFLQRSFNLVTVAATYSYDLPEDFSGLMGGLTYSAGSGYAPPLLLEVERVRRLLSQSTAQARPQYFSVSARATHERSRYETLVHPVPDAAYTLTGVYLIEPDILDDDNPYPLGGAVHSETVLESCLAAAEKTLNPESGEGIHAQRFHELLLASIELDRGLAVSPYPRKEVA